MKGGGSEQRDVKWVEVSWVEEREEGDEGLR